MRPYPVDGQVLFVTVGTPRLTALGWLVGKLDSDKIDVYTEKQVFGDQSEQENRKENLQLMTYSKDFAAYVALSQARVTRSPWPTVVSWSTACASRTAADGSCTQQSPVSSVLQPKDVITAIDDTPINVIPDLPTALAGKKVGDTITLTFKRGDETMTAQTQLIASSDGPGHHRLRPEPVAARHHHVQLPVRRRHRLRPDRRPVGRPRLHPDAARHAHAGRSHRRRRGGGHRHDQPGRRSVGQIGGLKQKTIAVMRTGAKVFLVPASEIAEAQEAAKGSDLKIVGVRRSTRR